MALAAHGGSDIVEIGVSGGGMRRLTSSGSIDVSPCFSPDGAQIVFNSDRGGDQQLYVMDAGGGGVRRISFGNGRYATPVWSPRGDLIAFTRLGGSDSANFSIGVMAPGRLRRAADRGGLRRRGTDLLPERTGADVLEVRAGKPRAAGLDRRHRVQRAHDPDRDRRDRPCLVAAERLSWGETAGIRRTTRIWAVRDCHSPSPPALAGGEGRGEVGLSVGSVHRFWPHHPPHPASPPASAGGGSSWPRSNHSSDCPGGEHGLTLARTPELAH